MIKLMKPLNNISRAQAIYRRSQVSADDLTSGHYSFVLTICREPGRSQEELARELCINKSTVTRRLNYLEEKGYISRKALENNKRQLSVYPTEKALSVLPEIRKASREWTRLLCENIPQEELDMFHSVLERMEIRAREIIEEQEENK